MCSLTYSEGINDLPGSQSIQSMLGFGCIIIGLFSIIFLFYTNSFLIKRRKKELGLYNILGMGKKHIGIIMFFESVIISFVGIVGGLLSGVILNKLIILFLYKLINYQVPIKFEISTKGIIFSLILFSVVFLLILLSNLARIHLSKPIELLQGNNVGEKEPKTKWIMTVLGIICIVTGYVMAITIKSPLDAFAMFFVAVILVIIGTYCLFTAGSIAALKLLRKNKKFYYQTKHFTAVSGMLYRMKQNAVGLANICILSTMVLVMVSTTVCLYIGTEDALSLRFPTDIGFEQSVTPGNNSNRDLAVTTVKESVKNNKRELKKFRDYEYLSFTVSKKDNKLITDTRNYTSTYNAHVLNFMTSDEYQRFTGKKVDLKQNEILIYNDKVKLGNEFELFNKTYTVKEELDDFAKISIFQGLIANIHYIVVANNDVMNDIYIGQNEAYGESASKMIHRIEFDIDGTDEQKISCFNNIVAPISEITDLSQAECKQASKNDFYGLYGGFLFLGLFLGLLFLMATVLIIYYKQISEGYEDKERFEIMQKVGMSHYEVKKSIRSQVLMVFFLPLIVACIHVMAAFNMITKLLTLLNLSNVSLFILCTVCTILVFAIIYAIVYSLTARVYYKIVNKQN